MKRRSDPTVFPLAPKGYPACPTCSHGWHGIHCDAQKWKRLEYLGLCPCETSVVAELDGAA